VSLKCEGATGEAPGTNKLAGEAKLLDPSCTTIEEAQESKVFNEAITNAIKATNENGMCCPSAAAKIQKFKILPVDFSVQGEELTATLKLKRSTVDKKYKDLIDSMY